MSKQLSAQITCPACATKFNTDLYRTLWIEYPENRDLVFNDEVNTVTCPSCNKITRLKFPFLCANVEKQIAVWYEPYYDSQIDKDLEQYKTHMGENSFYAKAPRIKDWGEFKEKIIELEQANKSNDNVEFSPEMRSNFRGFIDYVKKENIKTKYPRFLKHLSTNMGRILYSLLPFFLYLLLCLQEVGFSEFEYLLKSEFDKFLIIGIILTVTAFFILSLLHIIVGEFVPKWKSRKDIRLCCFVSVCWVVCVFLYTGVYWEFSKVSWDLSGEELPSMFIIMLVPPILLCFLKYGYDKYVK